MIIKNLTNSPFDLIDHAGQEVRIPARGEVDITPHHMHLQYYKTVGYFDVSDSPVDPALPDNEEPDLADKYEQLTGNRPDGRWSEKRLAEELAKLEG